MRAAEYSEALHSRRENSETIPTYKSLPGIVCQQSRNHNHQRSVLISAVFIKVRRMQKNDEKYTRILLYCSAVTRTVLL